MSRFQSYKLFYESYGYNFLLEDLIVESYISWDTFVISNDDHVKKYVPDQVISDLKETGSHITLEEIENAKSKIKDAISKLTSIDVSIEHIPAILHILSDILHHYSIFDTTYSEGIYGKNQKDERLEKIENSKNVLREDFDNLFFGENSLLEKLISCIAGKRALPPDSIRWYRKDELINLISKSEIISDEQIMLRKKAYAFDRYGSTISFFVGDDALAFLSLIPSVEQDFKELHGTTVSKSQNIIRGTVYILHRDHSNNEVFVQEMEKMSEGYILVTTMTDPAFLPAMKKSSAILTQTGGQLSHAAISARELNIPCIVGIENLCAILATGDLIEVDTGRGIVTIVKKA